MNKDLEIKKVLTIAGSDCSGGAGIQADLKTIAAHKKYGMSVITSLTAQNTTGVFDVLDATSKFVEEQIDAVFTDIFPDAVKIGMVSNIEIIKSITEKLLYYSAKNIVVDPVMVSTSGSKLMNDDACEVLINKLIPIADLITPNMQEAEVLCGFEVKNEYDMLKAAEEISKFTKGAVLIKGGHLKEYASDLLYTKENIEWLKTPIINNKNTHGTGCTLSSAIACNLAEGMTIKESVKKAKEYLTGAIEWGMDLGKGHGPLNHLYKF
ncbi:MAG: bifunctional hydroxymethylpyrimidine kinase/phosphomethylpyrimidine kinase [Clostridioides sp.]|jgi:hydroxymethylpyrimidine/phosphomethylpyrimidine kinase|nr:bifunctional hydroxymethylpyrimidine kinase/phosphomethylpyrimidine kinase [Clostridioides sp.]